jgi:chemotaxis protein MotB
MKTAMITQLTRNAAKGALLLLGLGLSTSCVTQAQYAESVSLAKSYQTKLYDMEQHSARLETENERLKAELLRNEAAAMDAGFSESVQARMSELQRMLEDLDHPIGDIERFDVDGGYVFMIQDKILFESGSADLGSEGKQALLGLAAEIGAAPHGRIFVRGHTDSDPVKRPATVKKFPHGNLQLSAERAVAVGALLVTHADIASRDVVVAGYGQWEPIAPNDSADKKRLNRRVEIFVADGE